MSRRSADLTGRKFGRLTVISKAENKGRNPAWNCACECGNEKVIQNYSLTSGKTQSCGCIQKEVASKRLMKHGYGKEKTHEYNVWQGMIARCENENEKAFPNYGGRGIKVCDRWRHSFENFLEDMGERPSQNHSIDRVNVNGNYEPSNCRWATKEVQARNTRIYKTNKTGVTGVYFNKKLNKFQARIAVQGKHIHLGCFTTLEEATKAREEAEQQYWN